MSDELIKKLANVFANQNKILQKLAEMGEDNTLLPPPPHTPTLPSPAMPEPPISPTMPSPAPTSKWDKKKAENDILDDLHLITRNLRDQKDIPEETRKHFIQRLVHLYDAIVLLTHNIK